MLYIEMEIWQSSLTETNAYVWSDGTVAIGSGPGLIYMKDNTHPSTWTGWYKRG